MDPDPGEHWRATKSISLKRSARRSTVRSITDTSYMLRSREKTVPIGSKHKMLTQCWGNVGSRSALLTHHSTTIGLTPGFCRIRGANCIIMLLETHHVGDGEVDLVLGLSLTPWSTGIAILATLVSRASIVRYAYMIINKDTCWEMCQTYSCASVKQQTYWPLRRWRILYKLWRREVFFQFEIFINVSASFEYQYVKGLRPIEIC